MIYVHVPFCKKFCTYCDFYSEIAGNKALLGRYADAVVDEIRRRRSEFADPSTFVTDTLYFGGGTPSVLPNEALTRILMALEGTGHGAPYEEFTMEVNPDDIVERGPEYLRNLRILGVDRLSIGIQSFDESMLRWMNRRHDAAGAEKAFRMAREAGFDNISIDLIFGLSNLPDEVWAATVDKAIALRPEHISCYQLMVEGESALAAMVAEGRYKEADEEQCRRQYDLLCARLSEAGYRHYEISNFALPGYEARHNSGYWRREAYIGLGPSAHSFRGDTRYWNASRLDNYTVTEERLSKDAVRIETIMLSLRTAEGIDRAWLEANCEADVLASLLEKGALAVSEQGRIRIPEDRFFVSEEIIRELI